MKKRAVLILSLLFFVSLSQATIPIAEKQYPIRWGGRTLNFPYACSHDLSAVDERVEHLIFSVHSSSYNAVDYYHSALAVLDGADVEKEKFLILAPHFLSAAIIQEQISPPPPADLLFWKVRPFWGSSQGFYNSQDVRISSFDVIDQILTDAVTGGNFPNLKSVVILGHSAGGQMVNRYAAGNEFEFAVARPRGIEVRYLVMAPSSYVYFTAERFDADSNPHFSVPDNLPEGYNNWGYGLEKLYSYHRRHGITAERIKERYPLRTVLYLVGEKDRHPNDSSLAKGPAAMLEGRHRLERGRIYMDYLAHVFGSEIRKKQRFLMVRGAGHSGRSLMTSPAGAAFIVGRLEMN